MDVAMRKAIEERAYALWEEAGRPDGSGLLYWLRAEEEFGIIPKVEEPDPLVTLQELAVEAQQQHEEEVARAARNLQDSVDDAVPAVERLPCGPQDNPLSTHVAQIAKEGAARAGQPTSEGGERVPG